MIQCKFVSRGTKDARPRYGENQMETATRYFNPLCNDARSSWRPVPGLGGAAEFLTLNDDDETGHHTRLTRFLPGAETSALGAVAHDYKEEVIILSGDLCDHAVGETLTPGHYACRQPGEPDGPFSSQDGCVVLEISFPGT